MAEDPLKDVYNLYAGLGKKEGMETFKSSDFLKLIRDAGLIVNKGNKFNTKPPNRVDYVFTYACTNGEGGCKGNKKMSLPMLHFAVRGICHELGMKGDSAIDDMKAKLAATKPKFDATQAEATRFHDDKSNYTGTHQQVHGGAGAIVGDKQAKRRAYAMSLMSDVDRDEVVKRKALVESTFHKFDVNNSGTLDKEEAKKCLAELKPTAIPSAIEFALDWLLTSYDTNNDGQLSLKEFVDGYNGLVDVLVMMGDSDQTPDDVAFLKQKFYTFCDVAPGNKREEQMDSARWKKFCNDTFPKTFPKTQAGSTKVDMIWAVMQAERRETEPGAIKITFDEFHKVGLIKIVEALNEGGTKADLKTVMAKILQSVPSSDSTKADYVKWNDDKDTFTGVHGDVHGREKKERQIKNAGW